jgi:Polymer-forming cytoskeletal
VEGTIDSTGTLTIGEHARIRGEIRTKSVKVRGTVEGNIFVTERCELRAGCTLHGDIEAPRLMVEENATFVGSAKVGTGKSLPAWRLLLGLCFSPAHMALWFAFTMQLRRAVADSPESVVNVANASHS